MNSKFACADFSFPPLSLEKALDLIALLEIPGIDIGLFENRGSLWPSKGLKNPAKSGAALKKKLGAAGLKAMQRDNLSETLLLRDHLRKIAAELK